MTTRSNVLLLLVLLISACRSDVDEAPSTGGDRPLFKTVPSDSSGILFSNPVNDTMEFTPFNTPYIYNGGGVAIGDLDGDSLPDLVFTGNQVPGKIYRNLGRLQFEDVTDTASFDTEAPWVTGVALADVNGDGRLDIYISRSGPPHVNDKRDRLFINQGGFQFTEEGRERGITHNTSSTQGYFFDMDRDEDLDLFVVAHPAEHQRAVDFFFYLNDVPDTTNQDRLYRNDGGTFTDITHDAGIRDANGFGLSAAVLDVNGDGWDDLFVANDFFLPDQLWLNQRDGTFRDATHTYFERQTLFSMGSDVGDVDGDGRPDLLVADMAPETMATIKTHMFDLPLDWYLTNERLFGVEQTTRNALYLQRNDRFVEAGELYGIARTDWSWSVFIEHLNHDDRPDIFISNGLKRDFHDNDATRRSFDNKDYHLFEGIPEAKQLISRLPTRILANRLFLPTDTGYARCDDLLLSPSVNTQGAALGDLDRDGDLDMVWNNTDDVATVLRNTSTEQEDGQWVRFRLSSPTNTFCVGCRVHLFHGGRRWSERLFVQRASSPRRSLCFTSGSRTPSPPWTAFGSHGRMGGSKCSLRYALVGRTASFRETASNDQHFR